jgi:hypothetical protein
MEDTCLDPAGGRTHRVERTDDHQKGFNDDIVFISLLPGSEHSRQS